MTMGGDPNITWQGLGVVFRVLTTKFWVSPMVGFLAGLLIPRVRIYQGLATGFMVGLCATIAFPILFVHFLGKQDAWLPHWLFAVFAAVLLTLGICALISKLTPRQPV